MSMVPYHRKKCEMNLSLSLSLFWQFSHNFCPTVLLKFSRIISSESMVCKYLCVCKKKRDNSNIFFFTLEQILGSCITEVNKTILTDPQGFENVS